MTASTPPSLRPWWTAFVCGMASYIDAAAIVTWGVALVIYQNAIGLTPGDFGLLSGLLTMGIAVGALVGGRLGDRFGRRSVFLVTMVAIILGATGMVFADAVPLMCAATVLVGLGTGADLPVSLATIAESAPPASRGRMIAFSQVLWLVGSLIPGFASAAVGGLGRLGGQILFTHVAVVALLVLVARLTIPESAVWLSARAGEPVSAAVTRRRPTARDLLSRPYIVPFLALIVFFALLTAGGNTLGQYGTYVLVNAADVPIQVAGVAGIVAIPAALGGAFWFMKVIGGRWRFRFFSVGAILVVVGALLPAVLGVTLPTYLVALVLFSLGGAFAGDSIMKFWTQRSFPTLLRTTAQGSIIAVARFGAAGFAFVAPLIIDANPRMFFAIIGATMLVGLAVAWTVFRTRDSHDELAAEVDDDADDPAVRAVASAAEPTRTAIPQE